MYIVSNVPPAIDRQTSQMNVYGGLAVAVIDSIPEEGAVWAGIVTDPADTETSYDAVHKVERLPVLVDDKASYGRHYAQWCKGKVYAAFHSLMEYAGLQGERYAEPDDVVESYYRAHITTMQDFGVKLAKEILGREAGARTKEPVMVHDYQLIELAGELRRNGLNDRAIGLYLHIPFPPPEDFWMIPHAKEILDAYLEYDMLGFQESEYSVRNFIATVKQAYPDAEYDATSGSLKARGRDMSVRAYAASIDPQAALADAVEAEEHPSIQEILEEAGDRKIIFSAQRFDIIKGVPEALEALELLLDETPGLADEAFVVLCCQSTKYEGVTCYDDYQAESMEIIRRIQEKYPDTLRFEKGLPREAVLGLMRHTDIMYIPTTIEGQNLVGKEYIAAREGCAEPGVLIMTSGCGAYQGLKQTGGIFIMEPENVGEHLAALHRALTILDRPDAVRIMDQQRQAVRDWTSKDYGDSLTGTLYAHAQGRKASAAAGPAFRL